MTAERKTIEEFSLSKLQRIEQEAAEEKKAVEQEEEEEEEEEEEGEEGQRPQLLRFFGECLDTIL